MRLWLKLMFVGAMTLVILIPLAMVNGLVSERRAYRAQAVADVMRMHAGAQAVAGPVLTVPYSEQVEVRETGADGVLRTVRRRQDAEWTFFPTQLEAAGPLRPFTRRRGLYEVPVYEWNGRLVARFDVRFPEATAGSERVVGDPVLGYRISDVRGIRGLPRLRVDGRDVEVREGAGRGDASGVHGRLAMPADATRFTFEARLDLQLAGTASLALAPLGKRNTVTIDSSWPHPSFQGLSPGRSRVDGKGFRAEWQVASVATDAQHQYLAGRMLRPFGANPTVETTSGDTGAVDVLGVVLGDPVDAYTRADRATKYGILFVVLTFVGFFMFEVVRRLPVHPVQYGLVGLALVLFFLLLVSLSEHIDFGIAYLVASAACIGLIGFYLSAVLRSALRGTAFAAMLALLYAALYGLLVSEDNALVLGAGLLFAILAALMVMTRHLDWYRVGGATPPPLPDTA
ncbi:cell envelope integrity protein CreD [Lysobacter xanthus]